MAFNPAGRPKKLGRYEIAVEVGKSPIGSGYIAVREEAPRLGFLRLIDTAGLPKDALDKLSEASWWSLDARDDNVFSAQDVVLEDGQLGIVSEYVEGEPLRNLLRLSAFKKQPATLPVALAIMQDIARGVRGLLRQAEPPSGGVGGTSANGNVCSDHVHLGTDGVARLSDPGVLSAARRLERFSNLTELAQYGAPEQHRGERADTRSDVFALGVIFWELLSGGKHLFIGSTRAAIAERITQRDTPRLEQGASGKLPPEVSDVVARALRREPSERYASMDELLAALESLSERASREAVGKWVRDLSGTAFTLRVKQIEKALSAEKGGGTSLAPRVATPTTSVAPKAPAAAAAVPKAPVVSKAPTTSTAPAVPKAPAVSKPPTQSTAPIASKAPNAPAPALREAPRPDLGASAAHAPFESAPDDVLEELEAESDYESLEMEALQEAPEDLEMEVLEPDTEDNFVDDRERREASNKETSVAERTRAAGGLLAAESAKPDSSAATQRLNPATRKSIADIDPIGASVPPPPLRTPALPWGLDRRAVLGLGGAAIALVLALGAAWALSRSKETKQQVSAASAEPVGSSVPPSKKDQPVVEPTTLETAKAEAPAPPAPSAAPPVATALAAEPAAPAAKATPKPATSTTTKSVTQSTLAKSTSVKSTTTKSTTTKSTTTKSTSTKTTATKVTTTTSKTAAAKKPTKTTSAPTKSTTKARQFVPDGI